MRLRIFGLLVATVATVGLSGCRSGPGNRSFVQRHPLLAEPTHYYEAGGPNVFTKVPSAVLVGVPVGVAKEGWQIINGH